MNLHYERSIGKWKRFWALIGTVVLHSALLAAALVSCAPPSQASQSPNGGQEMQVHLLPSDEFSGGAPCPLFYRGLGYTRSVFTNMVLTIAPGGPAYKAGLQLDDEILNDEDFGADRYMVGHKVVIHVRRGDRELRLPAVIGRICTD